MKKKLAPKVMFLLLAASLLSPQTGAGAKQKAELSREPAATTGTAVDTAKKTKTSALRQIPVEAKEFRQMDVSTNLLSMTEPKEVEVSFVAEDLQDVNDLEWTFGGKVFSSWQKYSAKDQAYSGEPFISFSEQPHLEGNMVKAKIKFDLVYTLLTRDGEEVPTSDLSSRSIRRKFNDLLGTYPLVAKNWKTEIAYQADLKLNAYDNYHTYDELKPALEEIKENVGDDRYLRVEVIGESVEGRDMYFAVLAKDRKSIDTYLNKTLPKMKRDPEELLEQLQDGDLDDYKVPIWFNNPHPDETPAMDAILELLREFATEDEIEFRPEDGKRRTTLKVDEVLDHAILLFNLSENPDGRVATTRANANDIDLNRDHTYQTQPEVLATVEQIAKWTPLSFYDFHGFVPEFLIEPCTPPHNPNFEYDLSMKGMIDQANAMGKAGIANTKYEDYIIPLDDYGNGWDDYTPAYTAVYAMMQGSFGHTVEVPEMNQDSFWATVYAGLGGVRFVLENKDELFETQLKIFQRGVEGKDDHSVDKWLVNQDGEEIGRPREDGENFFPEYYVIPVDPALQKNPLEAAKMVEYLMRNDVEVKVTNRTIEVDDIKYPKGTYVVDMHQAKRGFANAVLFDGEDISDWDAMYDSVVQNFHDMRGFTRMEVREEGAFERYVGQAKKNASKAIKTEIAERADEYIIRNTSNEAIKAVNQLLADGKTVKMVTESKDGYEMGDFLVSRKDLQRIEDDFYLQVAAVEEDVPAKKLKQPKVAAIGSGALRFVLKELGFELESSLKGSDVIVDDLGNIEEDDVDDRDYIGIGGYAMKAVKKEDLLDDFDYETTDIYHEGILHAVLSQDHLQTAAYDEEEPLYSATGTWITEVPDDAETLITVSDERDFFKTGWWPGHKDARGEVLAFTVADGDQDITLFANDLVWRAHPQFSYRLLANAIFAGMLND
ncbi:M14 family metallopeptidase [Brevibacillus fulvus]|uniref:Murein tripeptide amidase MpaA n=1 Tax=Brevibacillus fulvus TaxID=1125967 RepID=A0A938XVP0_9BACL|nr:M14 family zinc carboxypeptidase [Brevibacillus fulvus]MBM7588806.1 murein tripeptide amidase MpaA [Brevibacillus fulvus]